jgi:hypothetical protein
MVADADSRELDPQWFAQAKPASQVLPLLCAQKSLVIQIGGAAAPFLAGAR